MTIDLSSPSSLQDIWRVVRAHAHSDVDIANSAFRTISNLSAKWIASRDPNIVALGYFLRPSSVRAALGRLHSDERQLRRPLGIVLHYPPRGVETMTVYSWALSALAGNINIVRVADEPGALASQLVSDIEVELAASEEQDRVHTYFVSSPKEVEINQLLADLANARVIWGGDDTIKEIQRAALPVGGKEIVFPSRVSLALISATRYAAAGAPSRDNLARLLANDIAPFEHTACSSPTTLLLVGGASDEGARHGFDLLQRLADRCYVPALAEANAQVQRITHIDVLATQNRIVAASSMGSCFHAAVLAPQVNLELSTLPPPGLFQIMHCSDVSEALKLLGHRHQTLSLAGFSASHIEPFLRSRPGAIKRIVPIGSALAFDWVWDGTELLRELTTNLVMRPNAKEQAI